MKKLLRIHPSPAMHWVGNGFPVRSIFDYNNLGQELSPFLLLDYAAPYEFPPGKEARGVGGHPHRGFETVTVVYQGELEHRDSAGNGGKIGPGDVQWMTAASGIVHEEFHSKEFVQKGGPMQMVQLWINLPAKDKRAKAGYQTLPKAQIPNVMLPDNAGSVRVISGDFEGQNGAAKTFTPINLWDITLNAGKSVELPLTDGHNTAVLVLQGKVDANDGQQAGATELAVFSRDGDRITLTAKSDAKLLLMSGQPIHEPIVGYGPFVMNTRSEIQQAFEDFQEGRMGDL
ncbi:MAG: pirin family protein [Verrucomicrobiales bacterium]|jgi:redox-sensitive bicupin YhaK (pirin superfamily)|nr:pirin family protein [Verrucomicrobiales bacterium]